MVQPQIVLLKEGTDTSQGKGQVVSNINACSVVVDAVRTTLGPRGMDKLLVNSKGEATISNDGATIMKELDIVHPAAKTLVDIAKSQDSEVGDGTTTVVLLAGELLNQSKHFVEEGVHPHHIVTAYRRATQECIKIINEVAIKIDKENPEELRSLLVKCAGTSLNSKLIHQQKDHFAAMVVDAVMSLDPHMLPLNMIGMKKVPGGALEDSFLVDGVAFKKTFSYAGFEMQRKRFSKAKIAMLNIELELKAERDNALIRVDNPQEYQRIVDAEWKILYDKLDLIHASGANVVLSKLPIGDVATQYFADRDMFCAGRVEDGDLQRTMKACGGAIMTTAHDLGAATLGLCEEFEERQLGADRFNLLTGCPKAKTCTIILRGGSSQFLEETQRSLHDAVMIVRRALKHDAVVAGGGAVELALSSRLRALALQEAGRAQLFMAAYARALEVIPRQLCDNAGLDSTNVLNKLRSLHANKDGSGLWFGVDITAEDVADNLAACVWEPALVKLNALTAASEAACLVLSVDETIKSARSGQGDMQMGGGMGGMGRGRGRPM